MNRDPADERVEEQRRLLVACWASRVWSSGRESDHHCSQHHRVAIIPLGHYRVGTDDDATPSADSQTLPSGRSPEGTLGYSIECCRQACSEFRSPDFIVIEGKPAGQEFDQVCAGLKGVGIRDDYLRRVTRIGCLRQIECTARLRSVRTFGCHQMQCQVEVRRRSQRRSPPSCLLKNFPGFFRSAHSPGLLAQRTRDGSGRSRARPAR